MWKCVLHTIVKKKEKKWSYYKYITNSNYTQFSTYIFEFDSLNVKLRKERLKIYFIRQQNSYAYIK